MRYVLLYHEFYFALCNCCFSAAVCLLVQVLLNIIVLIELDISYIYNVCE